MEIKIFEKSILGGVQGGPEATFWRFLGSRRGSAFWSHFSTLFFKKHKKNRKCKSACGPVNYVSKHTFSFFVFRRFLSENRFIFSMKIRATSSQNRRKYGYRRPSEQKSDKIRFAARFRTCLFRPWTDFCRFLVPAGPRSQ